MSGTPLPILLPAQQSRLKKLWLDKGYTVAEVCEAMGFGEATLAKYVTRLDLPRRGSTPFAWNEELEARARELYEKHGGPAAARLLNVAGLTTNALGSRATKRGWVSANTANKPPKPNMASKAALGVQVGPKMQAARQPRPDPVTPAAPKVLADHKARECLFPVGPEPAGQLMHLQLFCCDPVEPGQRYCTGHKRFAVLAVRK